MRLEMGALGGVALVSAVAFVVGCGGEPDTASPDGAEIGQLVASVRYSDTHLVTFWDYGDGEAKIHETLNVDLDRAAPLRLADMDMKGRTLADTYLAFARGAADEAQLRRLRELDVRVLERARNTMVTPEMERVMAADLQGPASGHDFEALQRRSAVDPAGDLTVNRAAAACAEPSWDWQGDVGWFKNNFCKADSKFCPTEVVWASYGWYRGPTWFKATGFAQSHCAGARWVFKRRSYGGFPSYGISEATLEDRVLSPRTLDTEHWTTTGDRAYYCKVSSVTDANRTALSVHHNN